MPRRIRLSDRRSGEHARAFLGDWKGHLVVDDYAGYKALFALGISEVGCMAHARRKFFDLYAANQSLLATAKLNGIEPADWLKDTLEKLPTWPNNRIDELLPLGSSS